MHIQTKADEVAWLRAETHRITTDTLADCRKLLTAAAADRDHPPASPVIRGQVVRMCVTLLAEADRDLVALDHSLTVRGAA